MDPETDFTVALGIILTQVRSARRALEEVERNTSRYLGFEFARAFAEGPSFGAAPMYQGALKVHVININDLAPGNSFGDLLQGLLGGIGSLVGGVIGGSIGSMITVLKLPEMIKDMRQITTDARAILERLGVDFSARKDEAKKKAEAKEPTVVKQATTGETLLTSIEGLKDLMTGLTALFQAGSSGPGDNSGANAAGRTDPQVLTQSGERWMAILQGVNKLLDRLHQVVNGLILLIPILVGALAHLIANMPVIRKELLETFQFVLRNVLVLRGVILTTIFETVAMAARLTAALVTILGTTIQTILGSIVSVVSVILNTVFDALDALTTALTSVISLLLKWLVNGVFNTLREIGNLTVFRTIDHFVRVLPGLIEPIYMITVAAKANSTAALPETLSKQLNQAFAAGFAPAAGTGAPGTLPGAVVGSGSSASTEQIIGDVPEFKSILDPLRTTLTGAVTATGAEMAKATKDSIGALTGGLGSMAGKFDTAIKSEADFSKGLHDKHLSTLTANADALAKAISAPINATGPATGLEEIASAYQTWLTSEGTFENIFSRATTYLTRVPSSGQADKGLDLMRGAYDRPRASIEIDKVEIVIEPPQDPKSVPQPGDFPFDTPRTDEDIWLAWHRHAIDLEERAIRPADLRSLVA
jgi:hypothetical protein